ncbi:MAG: tRNA threonylcarbamoyladenosine biosynthesis protein TsaB [Actinomycetota bacterium]|nr:tRNA threonylcarbamoyladenosine biosynthesis protein TsaB [Actinomycetota bacterium]
MLLALDTATPAVTVAVADGDTVLAQSAEVDARRHGELLAPAIVRVLRQAGVDRRAVSAVAVGVGPGPFTGLRVGLVTARTLGAVLGVPVLGVCTHDHLALAATYAGVGGRFRAVTDARRKEVYWAEYEGTGPGRLTRVDGPQVDRPAAVAFDGPVVGGGARLYGEAFPDAREPQQVSAGALARWVAAGLPTCDPLPLYLRRPDAVQPPARKPVL